MAREPAPRSAKVLLVDGDFGARKGTALVLAAHGYSCLEASDSEGARERLDTDQDVGLVLCDVSIVGTSGMDLLRELTGDFPDVAVVMTSDRDDMEIADVAVGIGAFGYMIKPFDTSELLIAVASALRRRDLESAHRAQMRALEQTIARTRVLSGVLQSLDPEPSRPGDDEETIERLSRAVSLRDEETGRHIQRMSRYAVVLAEAVGFTGMSHEDLRLACALHDVGKIGVPDGILLKPGPLSPDEYAAMQRHSQIGFQLLAGSSSDLLRVAADIAFTHHEWWDGTGYPRGLQGVEIPEEARIAAITDVFDALTSNRVYRPALSFDEAVEMMQALRGRQFEPRLLDAFLGLMDELSSIRREYPDQVDGPERIRILIVDDHAIFSASLVRLLANTPALKVVGTAGNVAEAVAAAMSYEPDVVLMDFELPDGDGPHATERIKALLPAVKVVMLTSRVDDQSMVRAIEAGCSGFVKKAETTDVLVEAITAAHAGEAFTPPRDLVPLLQKLRPTHRGLGADLTPRELEILELTALGQVNKEIAQSLRLRLNTVRNHTQNILYKLHAHSKLEAVATAVREGIIRYPEPSA